MASTPRKRDPISISHLDSLFRHLWQPIPRVPAEITIDDLGEGMGERYGGGGGNWRNNAHYGAGYQPPFDHHQNFHQRPPPPPPQNYNQGSNFNQINNQQYVHRDEGQSQNQNLGNQRDI
jgi:hypothetical protein